MYPELTYSTPFFISSFAILVVGLFVCFQPRRPRGIWHLAALCFAAAVWAATEGMLYLGLGIEMNMRVTYFQHLGAVPLPPLLLVFTLSFFGYDRWLNRKTLTGLTAAAAAVLLIVWTNPLHHQVYRDYYRIDTGPVPMLGLDHGPLWWALMGYHYALTALVGIMLYRTMRTAAPPLRRQAALLLVLLCIVWGFNGVYVSGHSPVPNMDLGPLAFVLVAVAMARAFYRHNFLGLHPMAKATFFNALEGPILVLDAKKRLLDLNPAAEKLLKIQASSAIGREIGDSLKHRLCLDELHETSQCEVLAIPTEGGQQYFELRTTVLKSRGGSDIGHIYFFHDITERQLSEDVLRERERLQGVLEIAGTVSEDMAPMIDTIIDCSHQALKALPPGHPDYDKGKKLVEQTDRLKKTADKLMGITRYETRNYLGGSIIDIEKASSPGRTS